MKLNFIFNNSNEEKILGITIDNKLTFKSHIKILCRKAAEKMKALSRLRLIFNSLIKSQFTVHSHSSQLQITVLLSIWMFCSRTSNNMINF